jgi:type II secretory pathway component GspD/PulD (secretin)
MGNPNVGPALAPAGFRRQWYSKVFGSPVQIQGLTHGILPANPLSSELGQSIQSNPAQGALFQFRFLQSLQTSAVLQALRKDQTADQLLAPKLMQFNNQRSHIMVAQQRSYIKDYDVSGAVFDPVIGSFLTGVVLEVKPTVSNDKKYITLELHPGTAVELTPPLIIFITNGGNIATPGGSINLPIELPNLELRSISTTVTIPDNGTMLFSGLINDRKIDTKTGIPMLSDLPIIGRFFSTNNKERVRRNLLVLVNSRIILFDEEEANIAEKSAPLPKYPKPPILKVEKCREVCPSDCEICPTYR